MALRISKDNRDTLADMVLAHRVMVREKTKAPRDHSDTYWQLLDSQTATQYALDVALGQDVDGDKLEHIFYLALTGNEDAQVALIRLRKLGIIAEVAA